MTLIGKKPERQNHPNPRQIGMCCVSLLDLGMNREGREEIAKIAGIAKIGK